MAAVRPEEVCALLEEDGMSDGDKSLWESDLCERPLPGSSNSARQRRRTCKPAILTAMCVLAAAASVLLLSPQIGGPRNSDDLLPVDVGAPLGLFEVVDEYGDCTDYPFVTFHNVLTNNLGNLGPDSGDEGIVVNATVKHTGLGLNNTPLLIEIHNTSEYEIEHDGWQRDWNGIRGKFASFCVKHGTNVSLEVTARLPGSNETLTMPAFGMSIFDLDIGPNNSTEFVELSGFDHFYVTSNTSVKVDRDGQGTARFTASIHGDGDDNPDDPELLTVEQKHKSVTVEYSNVQKVPITVGAIGGSSGRVFSFTARPMLLCAKTETANGTFNPGEVETIENHTANGTDDTTKAQDNHASRDNHGAWLLGLVLSLSVSLLTTPSSA